MSQPATMLGSVTERLARNKYEVDEEEGHIEINQQLARSTGAGDMLIRICPAHVYSKDEEGVYYAEYAACLECGTCKAMAPDGVLTWHYPRGCFGVSFREG